jgi:predicted ATPase
MELLERETETEAIERAIDEALEERGRLLLIEGEAGAGKSALLQLAADSATARKLRVLSGRGGEYERAFPYGVIRQLFGNLVGDGGRTSLSGAAALAAPVFDVRAEGASADGRRSSTACIG